MQVHNRLYATKNNVPKEKNNSLVNLPSPLLHHQNPYLLLCQKYDSHSSLPEDATSQLGTHGLGLNIFILIG